MRPDSLVRTKIAEFSAETVAETNRYQVANAMVLDTRLAVGVMTALRWAVPAPVPEKYLASVEDAMTWLASYATARGMALTNEARAFVVRLHLDLVA